MGVSHMCVSICTCPCPWLTQQGVSTCADPFSPVVTFQLLDMQGPYQVPESWPWRCHFSLCSKEQSAACWSLRQDQTQTEPFLPLLLLGCLPTFTKLFRTGR